MNLQNFIGQLFANFPTLTLATLVVILALSKKFNVNLLLITSSILSLLSAIATLFFWSTDRNSEEVAFFMLMTSFLFSSVSSMFLYGVIQMILENNQETDRKQSILGMIGLSLITVGFYIPFWYIKRNMKYKTGEIALILYVFILMPSLWAHMYESSHQFAISKMTSMLLDSAAAVTAIYLALNLRTHILKENNEIEINPVLTFFFGPFYLQYKINQLEAENT